MAYLRENCDENLPVWLCIVANGCGYFSNVIWFLVLLPQLLKNYRRRSTTGLSFIWATCNFTASLINLFFIFDIDVPLFTRISGWYMPVLEVIMLLQFALYSKVSVYRKVMLATFSSVVYSAIISLECTKAFGPDTSSKMVWISIVLWSIQTYFQVILNMKRRSVEGQSYISLGLSFVGKTSDVIMQFSLIMPIQYVYMTYFSSTLAYANIMQLAFYTQSKWYTKPALLLMSGLLCVFAALLILRTSIVSIVCPIAVGVFLLAAFIVLRRRNSQTKEDQIHTA